MRIRGLFIILVCLLLVIIALVVHIASTHPSTWIFYLTEGLVIVTIIYLIFFYRKIVKPLHTISYGMDLLREQDFSSRLSKVGQTEADRIVTIFNRMMTQLKDERLRLREQNHFLDLLIKASPMGVLILTLDDEVAQCNPVAYKILGASPEEIKGRKLTEIGLPLTRELADIPRDARQTIRLNDSNIYKCTHSSFIDSGFAHSFYLIESLTEEVIKAEKKAYEKVIRMIAHEVNNTTAGITSTLDTIGEALSETENNKDICEVMQVCIERCYSMSKFITRFADVVKIPEPHFSPVDLNEVVSTCTRFMEGMCADRRISLRLETIALPKLNIDAALFEQVLVNIIKNAAESIEQDGEIIVRTLSPAGIEIIDNGKGISKEAEDKIFSPFFSTKPNGQGIGLIFIREVLTRHGCTFSLRTGADGLTLFRILFGTNKNSGA